MLQLLDPPSNVLARLEQARTWIAESRTIDEAKDIRDRAEAIRVYTTKVGYGADIQNAAREIVLRAKRRIGELARELPTTQGQRTDTTSNGAVRSEPSKAEALRSAGVTPQEATRCEQIAGIPESAFEKHLQTTQKESQKLTTEGVLKVAREYRPAPPPKPVPLTLPPDVALYCDDARSISLYVSQADLILTSPPYGVDKDYAGSTDSPETWEQFTSEWLNQAFAVTREHGRLALNIPLDTTRGGYRPTYAQAVSAAITEGWSYRSSIVWNEGNVTHSVGRGSVDSPNSPHIIAPVEMVALFSKGTWDRGRPGQQSDLSHTDWLEWTNGLWTFGGESRSWEGHPAAFPEELPRRLIQLLTFPGDLVVDPFVGSGTSAVVAASLGRRFVGIDHAEKYIDATRRRLAMNIKEPH